MKAYIETTSVGKATRSLQLVKSWLESNGFIVSEPRHPNSNGIDLTAMKGGQVFTFEVKSVNYDGTSWRVGRCSNKDAMFIAFAMPSRTVHIDTMADHLRLCAVDGSRRLTRMVAFHREMADKLIELLDGAVAEGGEE